MSERLQQKHNRYPLLRALLGISVLATAAGCSSTSHRGVEEAREIALSEYQSAWDEASPSEKFMLQYGGESVFRVDASPGGAGLLGAWSEDAEDYRVVVGNGCLGSTAYDIDGGSFTFSYRGLFVRASGEADVPTAAAFAEVDSENSDILRVSSGHTNSVDLTFRGLTTDAPLVPADPQTQNLLDTYGCETGIVSDESVRTVYLDNEGLYESL